MQSVENTDVSQLQKQWNALQRQSSTVSRALRNLSRLWDAPVLNLPEMMANLRVIEKATGLLSELTSLRESQALWIEQFHTRLRAMEQSFKQEFGRDLAECLSPFGLDLSGQYPDFRVEFFTIECVLEKSQAVVWYGPKQERMGECSLIPGEVAKTLQNGISELGSGVEPAELATRLEAAYLRTAEGNRGEPAPVHGVLPELAWLLQSERFRSDPQKEHYISYSRASFSYDLFLLRQWFRANPTIDRRLQLVVATRAYTRKRQDFLWVPDAADGRGTTYSHLLFRESSHG